MVIDTFFCNLILWLLHTKTLFFVVVVVIRIRLKISDYNNISVGLKISVQLYVHVQNDLWPINSLLSSPLLKCQLYKAFTVFQCD